MRRAALLSICNQFPSDFEPDLLQKSQKLSALIITYPGINDLSMQIEEHFPESTTGNHSHLFTHQSDDKANNDVLHIERI